MKLHLLFFTILVTACSVSKKTTSSNSLNQVMIMMQGSYDSEAQSIADSSYYNISLHMYPIWKDKGHFLYVEQALNSMQDKPYRQRVYEVKRLSDSTFGSYIYKIKDDSLWIGSWKTLKRFDSISPDYLDIRKGCEVILKKIADNTFEGSTGENSCESTLRGASFATSEVKIQPNKITSWDRGFDKEGNHIWGAEKGGYVFDKSK